MKSALIKPWKWFKQRKRWAKATMISFLIVFLLLFFASTIAKAYINANGKDLIGREVHISSLNINYFTCSISIGDFVMYEENEKDTFLFLSDGYVNLNPWQLFDAEYSVSEIILDGLFVQVIQYDSTYNFSDLISDEPVDPDAEPTKYSLKNVKIKNSSVHFIDKTTNNEYPLNKLNIDVPEISWNGKSSEFKLDFNLGKQGEVELAVDLDNVKNNYKLDLKAKNLDASYAEPYLKDYFNIERFTGFFHTDIDIGGSMIDATHIYAHGKTSLSNLIMYDGKGQPLMTADSIGVDIDSINVRSNYYNFHKTYLSDALIHSTFSATSSNFDYVMAPLYAEDTVTNQTTNPTTPPEEEPPFHFGIDETEIKNARIEYNDYSLDRPFHMTLSNVDVIVENYSEISRKVPVDFSMNINNSGFLSGTSTFDMVNTDNIQLTAQLKNLDLVPMSPYSEYYIAAPMTQGKFNYNLEIQMTSTNLINNNAIDIRELEFGKKIESDSAYKLPIKLALILLKDKNDNIQFEIPVTGNPADPDFKLLPIIGKTFSTFIVKAAASPFKAVGSIAGSNPEDLEKMKFDYGQVELDEKQIKTLDKIITIMQKKNELYFTFIQTTNLELEEQRIAILEAKRYYDSENWKSISDKDEGFLTFLTTKTGMTDASVEKMSVKLVGSSGLRGKVFLAIQKRNEAVKKHLSEKGGTANSILCRNH